jgi:hypothetical protein
MRWALWLLAAVAVFWKCDSDLDQPLQKVNLQ